MKVLWKDHQSFGEGSITQEPLHFNGGRFSKRILYRRGESTSFLLNFLPGETLPPHVHPGSDIYILVMEGGGTFKIEGEEMEVTVNEAVHFDGSEKLAFANSSEESTTLFVVLTKLLSEKFAKDI